MDANDVDVDEFNFNVNEVALDEALSEDGNKSARGSWRLLSDQNNRASWSPLHFFINKTYEAVIHSIMY